MAVKSITFVYNLEVPNIATTQENTTAHLFALLPFAEEKVATRNTTIPMEKPVSEDIDTLPEKDGIEKAEITGDSLLKQAPAEMAIDATPQKIFDRDAKMPVWENFDEMQVDSIPKEDFQEKAELATNQDFELGIADALEKVDINSDA